MPYTEKDYPDSFKNFDEALRKKAIEITNQLLADGYDENQAIPIATSQAKEWIDSADNQEIDETKNKSGADFEKERSKDAKPERLDQRVHVLPGEDDWQVKSEHAEQATQRFDKKSDAVNRAKEIAKNRQTGVIIHRADGTIESTHDYS